MEPRDHSRLFAGAAVLVTLAFLGGSAYMAGLGDRWFAPGDDKFAACRGGAVGGGDIGGPFTLLDKTGAAVTDKQVLTGPALVYFGYTFCPDVCPMDMARNADATDLLEQRGYTVTPIFISIDPERDTPEIVGEFAANLHPRMVGLTGTHDQVKAAAQAYKAYFKKQDGEDPDFYMMDHSTFTYLMMPGGGFADFFRREDTAEQMADRVACFIDHN